MLQKKDIQWLHELASLRGGKCLSAEYIDSQTKYSWQCSEGHIFNSNANNVQRNHWCPECGGCKKRDLKWLHELAASRGGKCVSLEYANALTKYTWECSKGHQWEAKANNIQQGNWCPECSGYKRHDLEWLHELAIKNNGKCLSIDYINMHNKYQWQCKEGHIWEAKANNIQQGKWCPECGGAKLKNIQFLHDIASIKNGKCLSDKYIDIHTKYLWQCAEGHTWEATANNIQRDRWCPTCFHKHSKAEIELYNYVKGFYPEAISGQRGILPEHRFELDIYLPSLKKAIEYDGKYWHSLDPEKDIRKNNQCQQAGISLLRISEENYIANKELVQNSVLEFLRG